MRPGDIHQSRPRRGRVAGPGLVLRRSLGRHYSQGLTLSNMGWVYRHPGKDKEAIASLQDAPAIFRELGTG
jgi:hypothetical protein